MGFRDDGEAARARAEALARELAQRDAEIEALKAQLEQKKAKLREVKEKSSPLLESAEKAERAQQALEALKEKNAEHARTREAAEAEKQTAEQLKEARERQMRLLKSFSSWADLDLFELLSLVVALPGFLAFFFCFWVEDVLYPVLIFVGLVLGVFAAKFCGRHWAGRIARREEEWARSLPYLLEGYPEVLGIRPSSRVSIFFHKLDGDEHWILSVELEFADGELPADLGEIMTGFDPELGTSNPLFKDYKWFSEESSDTFVEKPNVFNRLSPVTMRGDSVEDHNRAVRDWVRRFEREVLRPLHARHPLSRVTVRLR